MTVPHELLGLLTLCIEGQKAALKSVGKGEGEVEKGLEKLVSRWNKEKEAKIDSEFAAVCKNHGLTF